MIAFEISSFSLEAQVTQDDYCRYKSVRDIITKVYIPASTRKVLTGIAYIPTFTIDTIFSDFVLELNRLWSGLFFIPIFHGGDLDDDKLPYRSADFRRYGMHMMTTANQKK